MLNRKRTLRKLHREEKDAISSYEKGRRAFKRAKDPHGVRLMRHIQGEEKEHARELGAKMKKVRLLMGGGKRKHGK